MVRCWWFKIPFVNVETLDPSGVPKNLERVDGDRHSHESWFVIALKKIATELGSGEPASHLFSHRCRYAPIGYASA